MMTDNSLHGLTNHGIRTPRFGGGNSRVSSVVSKRIPCDSSRLRIDNECLIATWNITSMFEAGKIHNTIKEMKRLKIKILGISEMRWAGSGLMTIDNYKIYYSGEDSPHHRNGVALILEETVAKSVKNVVLHSDRLILVQLKTVHTDLNVIQVYAPTQQHDDETIENFYSSLEQLTSLTKSQDINIIMGDFNAKVGKGKEEDVVGNYGLGMRNDRGDRLIRFCVEKKLVISNTFFELPKRRLYTWKSPADTCERVIRNQIDFICISRRYRNAIISAKTYPGADVPSNHNLLAAKIRVKLKKVTKTKCHPRFNRKKWENPEARENITRELNNQVQRLSEENDPIKLWESFKNTLQRVQEDHLMEGNPKNKQSWMTEEILALMDIRRSFKNKNETEYKKLNNEIRRRIRAAKSNWHKQECEEIEKYDRNYDSFNLHKKLKEVAGLRKNIKPPIIEDKNGKLLIDIECQLARWNEYIKELFDDNRSELENIDTTSGPSITKEEVQYALKNAKNGKAVGPDEIHVETLKLLGIAGIELITKMFNLIYESGIIPSDWLKSTFVVLPKKHRATKCNEYRTISLMSHVLKLFIRIIHQRIYRKIEEKISNTQFGFRCGLGTREALFATQVLVQRCRDMNQDVFLCAIDFEKAFDKVRHGKMLQLLKKSGIDDKDIRVIANLYWGQTACVRVGNQLSEEIEIKRGVRQGCVLSPMLFNLYSEEILNEVLDDTKEGIILNGVLMNNIRYADDTLLLTGSIEHLQALLNRIEAACSRFGLNMNTKKTKFMIISKKQYNRDLNITTNNGNIERVSRLVYLGTNINEEWNLSTEIKSRIAKARTTFMKLRNILSSHNLSLDLRVRMIRCYIFPVLLYGAEAWTLTESLLKNLQAFEMWIYRRVLRISWVDRISNETVLRRMNKDCEIINTVKTRKLEYFGHIMRHPETYGMLQLIMQGKIMGRRSVGRRTTSWLKNLRQWFGKTSADLFRAAVNKTMIVNMLVNMRANDRQSVTVH